MSANALTPPTPPKPCARILYIEDNPQNIRLLRKMLQSGGFEMIDANNGLTGLERAATCKPNIILLDINLPDIDGVEVTRRLKTDPSLAQIPVIAVTANVMYGDRQRFIDAGCDGYLGKPVTRHELLNTVTYFLDKLETP
jgi:two-component system, cell cycle response regulator DivK